MAQCRELAEAEAMSGGAGYQPAQRRDINFGKLLLIVRRCGRAAVRIGAYWWRRRMAPRSVGGQLPVGWPGKINIEKRRGRIIGARSEIKAQEPSLAGTATVCHRCDGRETHARTSRERKSSKKRLGVEIRAEAIMRLGNFCVMAVSAIVMVNSENICRRRIRALRR